MKTGKDLTKPELYLTLKDYLKVKQDTTSRHHIMVWEPKETNCGHRPTFEEFLKFYGLDSKN